MRLKQLTAIVTLGVLIAGSPQGMAINIILESLSATTHPQILDGTFTFDEEPPAFDATSAGLLSTLQEIEGVYEDAFEDAQTIRITYWWDADMTFCCGQSIPAMMQEDANGNLTHAIVRINPTVPYYIDPTPTVDSEFTMAQRLYSFGTNIITPAQQAELEKVIAAVSAEAQLPDQRELDGRDSALIEAGRMATRDTLNCTDCHAFRKPDPDVTGPDLSGWGSREWLVGIIHDPTHERFYGKSNDRMPRFGPEGVLDPGNIGLLADWLRGGIVAP